MATERTTRPRSAKTGSDAEGKPGERGTRMLKKYPNRRLYDSRTSSYITLADVKQMVLACEDFKVLDAKSNDDLTRSILLQIILEEESGGVPMFSTTMLANIIRFYGHSMQGLMGTYLEKNLMSFVDMQNQLTQQSTQIVEGKAFSPENWGSLMGVQAPWMQNIMGNYVEQSRTLFTQMQEQMQKQAQNLFPVFAPGSTDDKPKDS